MRKTRKRLGNGGQIVRIKKLALAVLLILPLVGIALALAGFLLPYQLAGNAMPSTGQLTMVQQPEGGWLLSWPEAEGANLYCVEIFQSPTAEDSKLVYREYTGGEPQLLLPDLPTGVDLTLRVGSGNKFRDLLGENVRYGDAYLTASTLFTVPQVTVLDLDADPLELTVRVDVERSEGAVWQYQLQDVQGNLLDTQVTSEDSVTLPFASSPALPEMGESCHLWVQARREEPALLVLGAQTDIPITGESLRVQPLTPVLTEVQKNTITITWNESSGDHYEVQLLPPGSQEWTSVCQVSPQETRSYTTLLEPGKSYQYRVVSVDAEGESLVVSDPVTALGRDRTQYATIWPNRDLTAFDSPSQERVVGTARAATAYCVLEESGGMFAIRLGDEIGYIDSNYCMINLPEYLGSLCVYNITNSVYSIYAIHEFPIPNVTGVVTGGYEDVYQEDGSFLVPLLYPTARKLLSAAQSAIDQGYRLKIYDSFRPYRATQEIYDLTSLILDTPLPDTTYTGEPRDSIDDLPTSGTLTYGRVMTGSGYALGSFLAAGGSTHNQGVALDLTLEVLETGEQLQMQTAIHDLSHYSVLTQNNAPADLLKQIMTDAEFGGLFSEWWHYQDNDARGELTPTYLSSGVSAECWMKDDTGWKYRGPKGSYCVGQTLTISGRTYTFDSDGYVVQ